MKPWLKALIIVAAVALVITGGIFAYAHFAGNNPVDVTPANYWTLNYMPNRSELYGFVVSNESLTLYKDSERTVLEMFVAEGDRVKVGDPLLRYDATLDGLTLEEKLLEREKLYNTLQEDYAEYKRWAREDYERTVPTHTPVPTQTPPAPATPTQGTNPNPGTHTSTSRSGLNAVRLGARVLHDLSTPDGGTGTSIDPFRYTIDNAEPLTKEFLAALKQKATDDARTYFAQFAAPKFEIVLTVTPDGHLSFTVTAKELYPNPKKPNLNKPVTGNGSEEKPFVFSFASGTEVTAMFLDTLSNRAMAGLRDYYATLSANEFTVSLQFAADGGLAFYVTYLAPTPTPSPTPTPTPTPSPSPTPDTTESPEPTPYIPGGWGPSKAEREELARQAAQRIRTEEVQYRQLVLEIEKLRQKGADGIVFSTIEGTVTKALDPSAASNGESILEVRGGTGLHLVGMIGEMDLENYPVGTELTGFSYQSGSDVTVVITEIGSMPSSTSYSNGGNPNSSGYPVRMDFVGDVIPEAGEYIEFSDNSYRRPRSERTSNYLHEAYIREIDGQDCIFLVRDDVLVKTPVQTGKRMDEYIELLNLTLTADDYLAFPYDKNAKDGAPVKYPPEGGGRYW